MVVENVMIEVVVVFKEDAMGMVLVGLWWFFAFGRKSLWVL